MFLSRRDEGCYLDTSFPIYRFNNCLFNTCCMAFCNTNGTQSLQISFGQQLQKVSVLEDKINSDPAEVEVMKMVADAKQKLLDDQNKNGEKLNEDQKKELKVIAKGQHPLLGHMQILLLGKLKRYQFRKKNFFALIFA